MGTRVLGTRVLGGAIARFIPGLGWVMLVGDILYQLDYEPYRWETEKYKGNFGTAINKSTGEIYYWNPVSDSTLKSNITLIDSNVLEKLCQLKIYSYYYKDGAQLEFGLQSDLQYGFLVQEVELIFPELIGINADGNKYISFHELIPLIVKSISEQKADLEKLKFELEMQKQYYEQLLMKFEKQQEQINEILKEKNE
jgi:hypothetical protein